MVVKQHGADDGAEHRASASEQARAADHRRGDRLQLVGIGHGGRRDAEPRHQQNAAESGEAGTHHIGDQRDAEGIYALPARRLGVGAHGVEIASGASEAEEVMDGDRDRQHRPEQIGKASRAAREILDLGRQPTDGHSAGQQKREAAIDLQAGQRDDEGGNAQIVRSPPRWSIRPQRRPRASSRADGPRPSPCRHIWAKATPQNAATDPTERSMPAITIVHMTPIATMAAIDVWRIMLLMLFSVRKFGVANDNAIQSTTVKAMT